MSSKQDKRHDRDFSCKRLSDREHGVARSIWCAPESRACAIILSLVMLCSAVILQPIARARARVILTPAFCRGA
jgi:hypothetical protein